MKYTFILNGKKYKARRVDEYMPCNRCSLLGKCIRESDIQHLCRMFGRGNYFERISA